MRKLFLLGASSIFLLPTLWAAAIPDDAQRQLSSQTNSLTRPDKKAEEKFSEKPEIEIQNESEKPDDSEGPSFFVKKIVLEGNTVIPSKDLELSRSAFENRKVSFRHLRSFSEIITNLYRSRGYVTSRAYLPPQTVENDTVTVKIIEGSVGKIFVEGNHFFSAESYQRHIQFGPGGVFRYQDLEAGLYYLNQLPDRQAKAFLIPGEKLASSDIILKVKDKNPFHLYYSANNYGTKLTHRVRHGIHAGHNNFLGHEDTLNTAFTTTEEGALNGGSFSYNFPLENTPLELSLSGGYVKTRLIGSLKSSDIQGESLNLSSGLTWNLIQKPDKKISLYAGLEYVNSLSTVGSSRTSADRMRVLEIGPRIVLQDSGGRTLINSEAHVGLPGFLGGLEETDANASIQNSGGNFTFYTLTGTRLQRLPNAMFLILRGGGQWTADTLTSAEQYRAGGAYSVRGYPESDSSGDYGWNSGAELSTQIPFFPAKWTVPYTQKTWINSLRIVGFLEGAKTFVRERPLETSVKNKFLLGTGFGLRLNLDEYISGQLDLGFPIGDDSTDKNNPQVHVGMRAGF